MATIQKVYGLSNPAKTPSCPLIAAITPSYKITSEELIGIEVEVENVRKLGKSSPIWVVKQDGSLRNNGVEFVTTPIPASLAPAAMEFLTKQTLPESSCFSPRTSVHVHLNCQDLESSQVEDFLMVYMIFERLLYRFVGKQRIKNIYCVPIIETSLPHWTRMGQALRPDRWQKYTGLNLKPLENFGTIEFRHMHGTFDVTKVCIWIDLITKIKAFVLKTEQKTLRRMIADLDYTTNYQHLMSQVFEGVETYLNFSSMADLSDGILAAKIPLFNALSTHQNIADKITGSSPYFKVKVS